MFALQETLRIAVCGSGTGCCDSNATSGAVTAVLLPPVPAITSPVPTCSFLGRRPHIWHLLAVGMVLPAPRQGGQVRPCPLVPCGDTTPGMCRQAGAGMGWAGGEASSRLWREIQGKVPSPGRNPRQNTMSTTCAVQGLSWLTQDLPQHCSSSSGLRASVG